MSACHDTTVRSSLELSVFDLKRGPGHQTLAPYSASTEEANCVACKETEHPCAKFRDLPKEFTCQEQDFVHELSQDRKTEIKLESFTRSADHGASGHNFWWMNSLVHSQAQQKQFEVGKFVWFKGSQTLVKSTEFT